MLIAAMNPCPCGHFGDDSRPCTCSPQKIQNYVSRLSGPLLDRIDIQVRVAALPFDDLSAKKGEESSSEMREKVLLAREIQQKRFSKRKGIYCNANMSEKDVENYCLMEHGCNEILKKAVEKMKLSARGFHRILKVARTVADLKGKDLISKSEIAEAVQYRDLSGVAG
jgi:magnesium chelatase family protein